MCVIYLLFLLTVKTDENNADKNLTLKLIKQLTDRNDSIISAKNKEINYLLKQNEESKKRVLVSESIIDSLQNEINSKVSTYRRRKKRAGEFTDSELVNYWRDEVK
jgi:hypothetical protein